MNILAMDPGEHTGWVFGDDVGNLIEAGTIVRNHVACGNLIKRLQPDKIVYESFQLYPALAQKLAWNTFYTCEEIGIIKYVAECKNIPIETQQPAIKKYAGSDLPDYKNFRKVKAVTEHTHDAYQHYLYYLRMHGGLKKNV